MVAAMSCGVTASRAGSRRRGCRWAPEPRASGHSTPREHHGVTVRPVVAAVLVSAPPLLVIWTHLRSPPELPHRHPRASLSEQPPVVHVGQARRRSPGPNIGRIEQLSAAGNAASVRVPHVWSYRRLPVRRPSPAASPASISRAREQQAHWPMGAAQPAELPGFLGRAEFFGSSPWLLANRLRLLCGRGRRARRRRDWRGGRTHYPVVDVQAPSYPGPGSERGAKLVQQLACRRPMQLQRHVVRKLQAGHGVLRQALVARDERVEAAAEEAGRLARQERPVVAHPVRRSCTKSGRFRPARPELGEHRRTAEVLARRARDEPAAHHRRLAREPAK